ncbi:mitogen-activated protein kinase kinase kinase 20-like [Leptonychotes weddellii]|uniref:Mitogen-activated protein kinase kinase kinase 20-like n=1 Tax=Leptonychotes weddellii TaxID=9713 RepID=A0A7F8RJG4_LEPWE|nr:mitogen-activated protein kinase kinase kinase 20-like [Leptonychotes weddellii]
MSKLIIVQQNEGMPTNCKTGPVHIPRRILPFRSSAIEKLTHDYLNLFHFPPLIKDSVDEPKENEEKIVNLELVFGFHLKSGTGPQDCKWKMYMEMDGDEIAITYIKDVTFNTNLPDAEILKMTKPPFVMEKWTVGIMENQTVECTVTYEVQQQVVLVLSTIS